MALPQPKIMTPTNVRKFAGLVITSSRESINNGLFIALYGQGGVGKTTTAAMITASQHAGNALIFDAEAGSSSVAHLGDKVFVTPLTKFGDLTNARRAIRDTKPEDLEFKTYIFDNMTEIQQMRVTEIAGGPNSKIEIQHWGTCQADILRETRGWRDLTRTHGINVIFCIWEDRDKEEATGRWSRRVFFTPKLAQAFPGVVTMVGHILPVRNGPTVRKISFMATEETDAKFRVAPTESAAKIPLEIYYRADQPVLADLLDTIKDNKAWPIVKYPQPSRSAN